MKKDDIKFPDPNLASAEGLICIGGEMTTNNLLNAYKKGIFPWPYGEEYPMTWFSPDPRGIIFSSEYKEPRSFQKFLKKNPYTHSWNQHFKEVVTLCAQNQKRMTPSWINSDIVEAFYHFYQKGYAFSIEVLEQDKLVGGLYGVKIDHFWAGESMFHTESNASKYALAVLMQKLKEENVPWVDIQMVTPVTAQFGAREIRRSEYLELLKKCHQS